MDYLQVMREQYIGTIPGKIKSLEELLDKVRSEKSPEALKESRLQVHKIAGSAGTYGFARVSIIARDFEEALLKKMDSLDDIQFTASELEEYRQYIKEIANGYLRPTAEYDCTP